MNGDDKLKISNDRMTLEWDSKNGGACGLSRNGGPGWLVRDGSPEFALVADGVRIDGMTGGISFIGFKVSDAEKGTRIGELVWRQEASGLTARCFTKLFPNCAVAEKWVSVTNDGEKDMYVSRLDTFSYRLLENEYELMYFSSDWGQEFEQVTDRLQKTIIVLETRHGRSSKGMHPWFGLFREDGEVLAASVMWSGNWAVRFEPLPEGGYEVSGGLSDWEFGQTLKPGETLEGAHVAVGLGSHGDLNTVSVDFAKAGRSYWYPRNDLSAALPVEWNHWWPYTDKRIHEQVFKQNADIAAELGVEVCTLDAGWFGPPDPAAFWYDYRGDWDLVNTERFPSGIRHLSDYVHALGMKFGLWCEIEALGGHARLAESRPELVARRDGSRLGYVCFGSPEGRDYAFETLDRLILEYGCDWIKLDFNLDPGAGCNRSDHGHEAGDGLYRHYLGYYSVLERIREKHPAVILENCSSGGLRIDLGLMKHTHNAFLSDPDWPEHSLQLFWGATTMLAPDVCLHWSYSDWLREETGGHPFQQFNPHDPNLTERELDSYIRIGMLGGFGFSQKLPELPERVRDRFSWHIRLYKEHIRRFVGSGDIRRLTGQPKREGRGERWAAFQYTLEPTDEHLLFVFRLQGSEPSRTIRLAQLDEAKYYRLNWLSEDKVLTVLGKALSERGLPFDFLEEEDSALVLIEPIESEDRTCPLP